MIKVIKEDEGYVLVDKKTTKLDIETAKTLLIDYDFFKQDIIKNVEMLKEKYQEYTKKEEEIKAVLEELEKEEKTEDEIFNIE